MVPCKINVEEVSFEWSHHRISLTDPKVRTTCALHVSTNDSGSERVDGSHTGNVNGCFWTQQKNMPDIFNRDKKCYFWFPENKAKNFRRETAPVKKIIRNHT